MRRFLEVGWLAMLLLLCLLPPIWSRFSEVRLELRFEADCGESWRVRIDQGLQTKYLAAAIADRTTSVEQGHAVLDLEANCRNQNWIRLTRTRVHFSEDTVMTFEPRVCPCDAGER